MLQCQGPGPTRSRKLRLSILKVQQLQIVIRRMKATVDPEVNLARDILARPENQYDDVNRVGARERLYWVEKVRENEKLLEQIKEDAASVDNECIAIENEPEEDSDGSEIDPDEDFT